MRLSLAPILIAAMACLSAVPSVFSASSSSSDGDSIARHGQKRVLVLVDDATASSTHSLLLNQLRGSEGNKVTVSRFSDKAVRLTEYGEYVCDALVLLGTPSASLQGRLAPKALSQFVSDGGSVFVAADGAGASAQGPRVKELFKEFGFTLGGGKVVDHNNVDATDDAESADHTTVLVGPEGLVADARPFAVQGKGKGKGKKGKKGGAGPIVYSGAPLSLIDPGNKLASAVLRAPPSAYMAPASGSSPNAPPGDGLLLAAAVQGRNNARIVVAGSVDMFSDRTFGLMAGRRGTASSERTPAGNMDLSAALVDWMLHERGSLRIRDVRHYKDGEERTAGYRINDHLNFEAYIEEYRAGTWVPFVADDVQLEWIMMDPYIRTTLKNDGKGKFFTDFRVPDTYGSFKFKIDHRRQGFTYLHYEEVVMVRPFRHNEYERFIPAAYPYYVNVFTLMVAFFFLGLFFLYSKDDRKRTGGKSKSD